MGLVRHEGGCPALWCPLQDNIKPVVSSFQTRVYNKYFVLALKNGAETHKIQVKGLELQDCPPSLPRPPPTHTSKSSSKSSPVLPADWL